MAAMDGTFSSTGYKTCSSDASRSPPQEVREKHSEGVHKDEAFDVLQRGHVSDRISWPCQTQIRLFLYLKMTSFLRSDFKRLVNMRKLNFSNS